MYTHTHTCGVIFLLKLSRSQHQNQELATCQIVEKKKKNSKKTLEGSLMADHQFDVAADDDDTLVEEREDVVRTIGPWPCVL